MMPTANSWDLGTVWPDFPTADSNVEITSTTTRHETEKNWNQSKTDWGRPADYDNTGTLYHYTGSGRQAPSSSAPGGRYYYYWRTPTSFQMQVTIPQTIRDYVDSNLTAVVLVYCMYTVADGSWNYTYYADLWGFPLAKTAHNGVVTIGLSDIQSIMATLQQSVVDKGLPEFGWVNNKILSDRLECIMGCPLIMRLNDHTDFSALNWTWTP